MSLPQKEDLLIYTKTTLDRVRTDGDGAVNTIASQDASNSRYKTPRGRYSLGATVTDDIEAATQYWVDYESVREYPSPLPAEARNDTPKKKKKQHPPLIPNRLTDDSQLKIVAATPTSSTVQSPHPPRVLVQPSMRSGRSFDINTAWIELLIHEQQTKLTAINASMN
jgi:hypothetical protein